MPKTLEELVEGDRVWVGSESKRSAEIREVRERVESVARSVKERFG